MFRYVHILTAILAVSLAACGTATSNKRVEHHYAFGKPPPPQQTSSAVAPVVVNAAPTRRGPANTPHIVYFDFDSYTVRAGDRPILEAHARWLKEHPNESVRLPGHTDARGTIEYNLALGQKRADAVRRSLQVYGVPADQMEAVSYGEEQLADEGTSEEAHQRNRRVEFDYR